MRNNQPVTQREFDFPADATLMSTTDTRGVITYANAAFIAISGFEREELMGQPHNIVRHPDMPREAFADLWATLKAGRSWTGLVKNRRRNGDHYWVRANVTPVTRGGQVSGYMSVRTKPTRAEIEAALRSITALIDRSDSAATDYIHYRLQLLHAQTGRRLPIGYTSQVQSPSSIVLLDGAASSRAVVPSAEWDEERGAVLAAG